MKYCDNCGVPEVQGRVKNCVAIAGHWWVDWKPASRQVANKADWRIESYLDAALFHLKNEKYKDAAGCVEGARKYYLANKAEVDDCYQGIEQALEMNDNLRLYGTINKPAIAQAGQVAVPDDLARDAARWRFMMRVVDDAEGAEAEAMELFARDADDEDGRPESVQMAEIVDRAIAARFRALQNFN